MPTLTSVLGLMKPIRDVDNGLWGPMINGNSDLVDAAIALRAPLASPALTGVPTAPQASVDSNTGQLATTSFYISQAAVGVPLPPGVGFVGYSHRYARQDHVHPSDPNNLPLSGGTVTGPVSFLGRLSQGVATMPLGTMLDLNTGNCFRKTVMGAATWSIVNAAGSVGCTLELTNGGLGVQTWPANMKWPGGLVPVLSYSGLDVLVFFTTDAGLTWRGVLAEKDSR